MNTNTEPREVRFDLCPDGTVFVDGSGRVPNRTFRSIRALERAFVGCNVVLIPVVRESFIRAGSR
jgi:hypothetical protein